jgi:pilus assembly protein CpaB
MNRRRVIGGVVAVSLAGLGAVGIAAWANDTKASAEDQQAQTAVVIVDKHVPKGADAATILADTHVGTVQRKNLAAGALTSDAQIGNQVAADDLEPGDQLVAARLAAAVPSDVPADKVQLAVKLAPEAAVGGALKIGDKVGVYLSFDPFDTNRPESDKVTPPKTPSISHLTFEHVLVTNIQTTGTPVSQDTKSTTAQQVTSMNGYIVTLALTPAQSEKVVFGIHFGHVYLSNDPVSVKNDGTGVVTEGGFFRVVVS